LTNYISSTGDFLRGDATISETIDFSVDILVKRRNSLKMQA